VKDIFKVKAIARDLFNILGGAIRSGYPKLILQSILRDAIRSGYPKLIIVEYTEQEAVATFKVNILRGSLKIALFKAWRLVNTK